MKIEAKVGDWVECVDPGEWALTKGGLYRVEQKDEWYYKVRADNGQVGGYDKDRFRLKDDGPVRTRTVTEIVPGRYGEIEVGQTNPIGANYVESVLIGFGSGFMIALDEPKLTAAIETLTQIRDALKENG